MKLPSGWIFIPHTKDGITVQVEQKELICCSDCAKRKNNGFCLEHMRYEKDDNGYCSYAEGRSTE